MEVPVVHDSKDVSENKDLAALGYVWVLSIVMLFSRRDSAFIKYHARQGAVLFVLSLIVWAIPFVGKLAEIVILILCVVGFLNAAQGMWRELPIIGPLSRGSMADLRYSWRDTVAIVATFWQKARGKPEKQEPKPYEPPQPPPPPTLPQP